MGELRRTWSFERQAMRPAGKRLAAGLCLLLGLACAGPAGEFGGDESAVRPRSLPGSPVRLLAGVGDRIESHPLEPDLRWLAEARAHDLPTDLFQIWLPRDWWRHWSPGDELQRMADEGTVPVVVHYFFGDGISRQRVLAQRDEWHASLRRLGRAIRIDGPVLVVLEPEFNDDPPAGESRITDWPGFAGELAEAVRIVRDGAPNALVGVCAGDFSPDRNLQRVLEPVAHRLDFLAYQEMRAASSSEAAAPGYLDVGQSAVDYARYLQQSFGKPILLAYVAVSSWGGWEKRQAEALAGLARERRSLRRAGVFGVVYFQLRDDPEHEGYFGPAEKHFGLLDARGREKPAAAAFRELVREDEAP
jgi:hypothetical protein